MKIRKFIYPHDNGLPGTWWIVQIVHEFGYVLGAAKRMASEVSMSFKSGEIDEDDLEISRIGCVGKFIGFGTATTTGKITIDDERKEALQQNGWTFLDAQPDYLK